MAMTHLKWYEYYQSKCQVMLGEVEEKPTQ
jgi:hypothetical protein